MARRVSNRRIGGALVAASLAVASAPAGALVFSTEVMFAQQGRSLYAPGAGVSLQGAGFLGVDERLGRTIGVERCVFFVCGGATLGAEVSARIGFDYSYRVDSGTFDFQAPGRLVFTAPDAIIPNGPVAIGSSFTPLATLQTQNRPDAPAFLQVNGPTAQATLGLAAEFSAGAQAQICFAFCVGPALGPVGFNESRQLASINPGNNGTVTVLGETVSANRSVSALGGLVNASLNIPDLDGSSLETPGGFAGLTLTAVARDRVAGINANIAQIAANAVGLPIPLSGRLGPIGYNLLEANAGLGLDVEQTVALAGRYAGSYIFAAPIVPIINGVAQALTTQIDFDFGDTVSFLPGQNQKISFLPVITLEGFIRNQLDLIVNGQLTVKALGASVAGLELGPLIDTTLGSDEFGRVGLYDISFRQNFGSIIPGPITLDFVGCQAGRDNEVAPVNICGYSEFVRLGGPPGQDDLDQFYSIRRCAVRRPGQPEVCTITPFGFGSDRLAFSNQYTNDRDFWDVVRLDPDTPTTDAEALALVNSLGYSGPPAFVLPEGASFESFAVPEPGTWALMALGFGLAGAAMRRRRAAVVSDRQR